MSEITRALARHAAVLSCVRASARAGKTELFLVGGVLRDVFIRPGRISFDLDFALPRGAIRFARGLARELKAGFVALDERHGCGRVVLKKNDCCYTLDFSDFRGPTIEADLLLRDFTVNSMALPLEKAWSASAGDFLLDPAGGKKDCARKLVRRTYTRCFRDDPVRIARAYSTAALAGMRIEKRTLDETVRAKGSLATVSGERVRDELFKILASDESAFFFRSLADRGILQVLIPSVKPLVAFKNKRFGIDVWRHTLDTLRHIDDIIKRRLAAGSDTAVYLSRELSGGRKTAQLLKLAAVLHDVGKPQTFSSSGGRVRFYGHEHKGALIATEAAESLKLSNEERRLLRALVLLHLRPGYMACVSPLTRRASFRFFRDSGQAAPAVLLLSLADQRATRGYAPIERARKRHEALVARLINEYFRKSAEKPFRRLVSGDDLMKRFRLEPSPLIGAILRELDESQSIGKLKTAEEAYAQAKKILSIQTKKEYYNGLKSVR